MLALYLSAFVFGGVFIAATLFFGGSDHDLDHDVDVGGHDLDLAGDVDHYFDLGGDVDHDFDLGGDVDHDLDLDGDVDHDLDLDGDVDHDGALEEVGQDAADVMWLPFLSLRFWTYAFMSFGLTGTILHLIVGITAIVLPIALVTGLTIGTGAAWIFRKLKTETVSAEVGLHPYVGSEARVLLEISKDRPGKIIIDSLAGSVELMAVTGDDKPIPRGSRVLIADIQDGRADVTSLLAPRPPQQRQRQRSRS